MQTQLILTLKVKIWHNKKYIARILKISFQFKLFDGEERHFVPRVGLLKFSQFKDGIYEPQVIINIPLNQRGPYLIRPLLPIGLGGAVGGRRPQLPIRYVGIPLLLVVYQLRTQKLKPTRATSHRTPDFLLFPVLAGWISYPKPAKTAATGLHSQIYNFFKSLLMRCFF